MAGTGSNRACSIGSGSFEGAAIQRHHFDDDHAVACICGTARSQVAVDALADTESTSAIRVQAQSRSAWGTFKQGGTVMGAISFDSGNWVRLCGFVLLLGACSRNEPQPADLASSTEALNAAPKIADFAIYAQNSVALKDRVVVSTGDVGVKNVSAGPTLVQNYELALTSQAQVDTAHNVIANRILLQDRAVVGDVETNKLTNQFSTYAHQYPFPTMPAMPTVSSVAPGSTALTVAMSQTTTISASNLGAVYVKTKGILRLNGGTYQWSSLQLDDDTRLEALAPVQIRVSGRIGTLARVYVGPATGTGLLAKDVHIEVSGRNGTSGSLTDTPKATAFGNDNTVNALLVVPNGTLQFGQRASILGAVAAKDVYVDIDSRTTYQSGFGPPPCVPADCNDQNACTTDVCSEGTCSHTPVAAGVSCSDGNACNGAETCNGKGACAAGAPVVCQASDACHDVGVCDPPSGQCSNPAKADGTGCNDNNACTQTDTCVAGKCTGNSPIACTAPDQCHDAGSCDPTTGKCSNPNKPDGATCNDGNSCTQTDQCKAGTCTGTNPVQCAPVDQCHQAGQCDPATGQCSNPAKPNGSACTDGNACTLIDACASGICVGTTPVACAALDQCHDIGICDPLVGTCSNPEKPGGTPCNDGNLCTQTDTCLVGVCMGSNTISCSAQDQCHNAGVCAPQTGTCTNPAKPDGSACNDGNACTQTDACVAGACTGSNPVVCVAQNQCHDIGSCDQTTGSCSNPTKPDGSQCSDRDACTAGDQCLAGNCQSGSTFPVDDNNPCTVDACDAVMGVTHTPVAAGTSCSDSNACNGMEVCSSTGNCMPGTAPVIDDGNPCTADSCDPIQGVTHKQVEEGTTWAKDGRSCVFDDFNGSALAQRWSGSPIGTLPTYVVDGSRITITDAAFANTPSNPGTSWIYEADTDLGNQIVWPRAVGTDDFDISFEFGWSSNAAQLTLAGIGLTNASNQLELRAGIYDGSSGSAGGPFVTLRTPGPDQGWYGTNSEVGSARMRLLRQAGNLSVSLDGQNVYSAPFNADIQNIVIFAVRHRNPTEFEFGTFWLDDLSVCYPNVDWNSSAACSDGDPCNGTETCSASGSCVSGTPPTAIDDGNPCTDDSCQPDLGGVVHKALDGTVCGSGNTCQGTLPNICRAGQCLAQTELVPFGASNLSYLVYATGTVPANYWQYTFDDSQYSLGAAPFGSGGGCPIQARRKTQWPTNTELVVRRWIYLTGNEGNLTIDIAIDNDIEVYFNEVNITGGLVSHEGCADSNLLSFTIPSNLLKNGNNLLAIRARDRGVESGLDIHLSSSSGTTSPPVLDDGNPCTADSCDPINGVQHTPVTDGTSCSDSNICNGAETCQTGTCIAGTPLVIDDGNPCTTDTCDPLWGVAHTLIPGCGSIPVPNVVGLGLAPASSTITNAGLVVGNVTSSVDGLLSMQFDSLPSQRGWGYEAYNERSPEERLFHVDGGVLTQNSMGIGYGGSCDNTYVKYGVLDPTAPFTIEIRARLLDEEYLPNNHFGFGFGAEVPTAACDFGLGKGLIQDISNQTFAVDTSIFHDYRAECDPIDAAYRLFVDGNLIASSTLPVEAQLNRVLIGDFTCGANAHAEVTQFQVAQNIVASQNPGGGTLVAPASSVNLDLRTGPATARVPDVGGTQESDALQLITQAGLQSRVVRQHSPTVPLGAVIKTLPLPGSRALPNDTITVTISLGAPQCVPPPTDIRVWFKGEGTNIDAVSGTAASPTGGVSYYSAVVGQGLAFADGYVELPHSGLLEFHGQMTMEAWLRPNAGSGNIFSKSDDAGANGAFLNLFYQASDSFGALSGRLAFTVYAENGSSYVQLFTPPSSVRSGEWVHFAAVDDGSNLKLYLNGTQVASGTSPPAGTNLGTLVVGAYKRGTSRDGFFGGGVNELSIYGRALTADEIASIYAADIGGKCTSTFNTPPVVNAGPDQVITLPATATLVGTATDDGLPAGSALACAWSQVSGLGSVTFAAPTSTSTTVAFPVAGVYDLKLTCTDGLLSTSDDVVVTVNSAGPGVNQPPVVNCGPAIKLPYPQDTANITCTVTDDGLPLNSNLATQWSGEGPGNFQFLNATATSVTVVVPVRGVYTITLTATDGELSTTYPIVINAVPPNQAPVVSAGPNQTITLPNSALLAGTVTDDGLPEGATVSACWSLVSGPGNVSFATVCSPNTAATFSAPGTYVLSLEATDTLLTSHSEVTIVVQPQPVNQAPIVSAGPNQTINLPSTLALAGVVTDDGLPNGGTLTSFWSLVSGPAPASFNPVNGPTTTVTFTKRGTYVLRLTANDSALQTSADLSVQVYDPVTGPGPAVAIAAPTDGAEVTGMADITGTVTTPNLDNYILEYRDVDDSTWTQFASGTSTVSGAKLGTLDPTVMLNGTYELRLTATDTSGQTTSDSITASLTRNQKVGNFTVSFKDLSVPVAGIPIEVIRTYDSREKRQRDFGVGWSLDINSLRVQKNRVIAETWETTVEAGGPFGMLEVYCVVPSKRHYVTVTFADGKVFRWEAKVVAPGGGYNGRSECQLGDVFEQATVQFVPLAPTTATLTRTGGTDVLVNSAWPGDAELVSASDGSSLFDPDQFVVTLQDGRQLQVKQATGLERITDTNGNVLEVKPEGLFHSSGESIQFARDAQGRIAQITDPSGNKLNYTYSASGDLATFSDAINNKTTYTYDTKHYLLGIFDPRGIEPIRNEYDDSGRLISHTDPYGNQILYNHDVVARRESVTDRLGNVTVHEYDDRGNVLTTTDALGNKTTYTYDDDDNKLSECNPLDQCSQYTYDTFDNKLSNTDPLGNKTSYTYDGFGNVLMTTDPLGHVTQNQYDGRGNLTQTIDAAGQVSLNEYNGQGLRTKSTDALGNITSYAYDATGNLVQETDASGHATTYAYDANGNRISQSTARTTAAGSETLLTQYVYDAAGHLLTTTNPDGSVISTEYNAIGQQSATIDALGRRTARTYDDLGRLTRTDYPDGTFESTTYDAEGHRIASVDRAGRTTTYAYDALGRLTSTTYPDSTVSSTAYDAAGRTASTTDETGAITSFDYDAAGRRTAITDPLGNKTTFVYDTVGNQVLVTDPLNRATGYVYDALSRRVQTVYADGSTESTEYDALGRRTAKIDQAGVRTEFTYDALGRLIRVKDALNGITSYAYNELGNQVTQTDALGRVTRFDYDAMGRRTRRTLPLGAAESMTYDLAGNLIAKTDFMGRTTAFAYDVNNRLTQKTFADGSGFGFTYLPSGRRATAVDARGTTAYTYDARDRLTAMTYPDGRKLGYGYDARGNRQSLGASIGSTKLTTSYTYNAAGQLATVTDPNAGSYSYAYDASGARTSLTQPNGTVTTYTYDPVGHLKTLATVHQPSSTTIQSYTYTLGPTGIRTRIDELGGVSRAYSYDALYRLTNEAISGTANDYTKSFAYDAVGNRLTQSTTGFSAANVNYTYDDRDRLLTENSTTYGWDENGNLISKSGDSQYTWDFEDHLIRVTKADGTVVEHTYDVDGVRVQTKVTPAGGGVAQVTNYLVDTAGALSHVVAETDGTGAMTACYVRGGDQLLAEIRGTQTRYYHEDGLGSVRALTDANGAITDDYGYTAFGEAFGWTGADLQPYRFAGEEWEAAVNLHYLRARHYLPGLGTFISPDEWPGGDETPQSFQKYVYGNQSPASMVDPTGHFVIGETLEVVAAVSSILSSISVGFDSEPATLGMQGPLRCVYQQGSGYLRCQTVGGPTRLVARGYSGFRGLVVVDSWDHDSMVYQRVTRKGLAARNRKSFTSGSSVPPFVAAGPVPVGPQTYRVDMVNEGEYEDWPDIGPIPRGSWVMNKFVRTFAPNGTGPGVWTSPNSIWLNAVQANAVNVKSMDRNPEAFRIHGGTDIYHNLSAISSSAGCIVLQDHDRNVLADLVRGRGGILVVE